MAARLAILTPSAFPTVGGNSVTVDRVSRGLRERGLDLAVWDLSALSEAAIRAQVDAFHPGVVHAFHAYRTGPLGLDLASRLGVPLVVTLTGTDANEDLVDPARAPVVRRVLAGAAAITAFHQSMREAVAAVAPEVTPRLQVVPQAVQLAGAAPFDLAARWRLPAGRVLFTFAGGIRAVKGPRVPLAALDAVAARRPSLRLLYAGPVIEEAEGLAFAAALATRPWACHVGSVPHAEMPGLLAQTDVVLNCSRSEGGMPNVILEALWLERAVLASDIPGNRALVEHDVTGLLFRDATELAAAAERLALDADLRARLGAAGAARVRALYPPNREIDAYLDVYGALAS